MPRAIPFLLASTALAAPAMAQVPATSPAAAVDPAATPATPASEATGDIVVTARRRAENLQEVPIAISVLTGAGLAQQATFSVAQVTQLAPTLQFTSSNPRNTALNIRGLGVSFGLANDGLEQGVGFYVDGVYNSRPAAAAFDLLDIDRIEVLRGPQGTLFGKNTTAGALNITTALPSFDPAAKFEGTLGTRKFVQAKGVVSGPLVGDTLAARLAVGYTSRDGFIRSTKTGRNVNDLDNLAIRGQLLWKPSDTLTIRLIGDYNLSDADCCTQVTYGYGATLKPAARQFPALATALGYVLPSTNPYDRIADVDARLEARSEIGGASVNADLDLGAATLTSITAWRHWDWQPANDRDYIALDIVRQSANPVQQDQYSQELRLSSDGTRTISYTVGAFAYYQKLHGQNATEWGRDASFWLIGPTTGSGAAAIAVPTKLIDGYLTTSRAVSTIESYAGFAQVDWAIAPRLKLTPGLRYTYETKKADYAAVVGGGLATTNALLVAAKNSIFRAQSYQVDFTDDALTGAVSLAWEAADDIHAYVSYARGFKSGGINLAGLPLNTQNNPALNRAVVGPERNETYEAGLKTRLFDRRLTANFAVFRSDVRDFQANVVDTGPGALRGYLANIAKVRSQGAEFDLSVAPVGGVSAYLRGAYTDANYVSFANAPCPLELIASTTASCDLSGRALPGASKWALSAGGEYRRPIARGQGYVGVDANYRSATYADSSDSRYLKVGGYGLVNARIGYASDAGWEVFGLVRNLFDKDYATLLTPQTGNSGLYSGVPGDPRTFSVTVRAKFG